MVLEPTSCKYKGKAIYGESVKYWLRYISVELDLVHPNSAAHQHGAGSVSSLATTPIRLRKK